MSTYDTNRNPNPFYTYNNDTENETHHPSTHKGNTASYNQHQHSSDSNIDLDDTHDYESTQETQEGGGGGRGGHRSSTSSPSIEATYFHKVWACCHIVLGVIARTLLLWSLIDTAHIPYLYVTIVLFEWIFNTWYSYYKDEYFPGSMYNDIHTILHGRYFTGTFTDNKFSHWYKLRMFLLVISLNLSIPIALNSTYDRSTSNPNESKIITAWSQARILIPLILEFLTVLLNTIFTLVVYVEVIVRTIRYLCFLALHLAVPFFGSLSSLSHRAQLWPLHFHTYKAYSRSVPLSHLEMNLSDDSTRQPNYDDADQYAELGDDQLGLIFFPIYTFLFKWIGY